MPVRLHALIRVHVTQLHSQKFAYLHICPSFDRVSQFIHCGLFPATPTERCRQAFTLEFMQLCDVLQTRGRMKLHTLLDTLRFYQQEVVLRGTTQVPSHDYVRSCLQDALHAFRDVTNAIRSSTVVSSLRRQDLDQAVRHATQGLDRHLPQ